jgi:hypothetical protein
MTLCMGAATDIADKPRLEALWFKGEASHKEQPGGQPSNVPEAQAPDAPLCCARCGQVITHERHRTTVNGRHTHTRVNPHGFVFHFGCFAVAEGCLVRGPPTAEDSWFAGYFWEYAYCANCHAHLGWAFHGDGSFFGLMLDRLSVAR